MSRVRVWAPHAGQVALWRDGHDDLPMERGPHGVWTVECPLDGDYAFVLDGDRLPDPRSRRLPHGPHGPSGVDDPSRFDWHDQGWRGRDLRGGVLYELHIGTFSTPGTFDGAIAHLDHLVEVGVDAIEVMPIATFDGDRGWGYDGVGLYAPHEAYGGPAGFRRLVDAAHQRGLGVVLDVVYNHLGPSGNYLGRFGPYFDERIPTPWGASVNFDGPGSDEVRSYVLDNVEMWISEFHVDGLRLDAVHALHDRAAVHILEDIARAAHDAGRRADRHVTVFAESDLNDPRLLRPVEGGGLGLDVSWSDEFHHCLRTALTGTNRGYYADYAGWPDVVACIQQGWLYDGRYSRFRDRHHGRPLGDVPLDRLLGYTQTHDQVGNSPRGDRPYDPSQQVVAAAITMLSPYSVMLFQGEEWATRTPFAYFVGFPDPDLADAVRRGRAAEFSGFEWDDVPVADPADPATAAGSVLRWDERDDPEHARVLRAYRTLIELRRGTADEPVSVSLDDGLFRLRRGRVTLELDTTDLSLVVRDGGTTVVVVDPETGPQT
ncbi:MAG: malto-oligosyltrehalose trehalohydrolase [Ilumatobacteraceae bacterium]